MDCCRKAEIWPGQKVQARKKYQKPYLDVFTGPNFQFSTNDI